MPRLSAEKKSEYITISELAKLVSISPQAIYKKMKQKPSFNRYIRVFDGKKYVHKSAAWEEFGVVIEGFESVEENSSKESQPDNSLVRILTDQIQGQRQQIESLQRNIDGLMEALKAEQLLRASADQRIALLEDKLQAQQQSGAPEPEQAPEEDNGSGHDAEVEPETTDPGGDASEKTVTFLDRIKAFLGL